LARCLILLFAHIICHSLMRAFKWHMGIFVIRIVLIQLTIFYTGRLSDFVYEHTAQRVAEKGSLERDGIIAAMQAFLVFELMKLAEPYFAPSVSRHHNNADLHLWHLTTQNPGNHPSRHQNPFPTDRPPRHQNPFPTDRPPRLLRTRST